MKTIIISLLLLISIRGDSQDIEAPFPKAVLESGIDRAQVTIPYGELKQLLRAANLNEIEIPKLPVEAVLKSAEYLLDLSKDFPVLSADFVVRTFCGDWHSVPLFGGSPGCGEVTIPSRFYGAIKHILLSQMVPAISLPIWN